MPHSVKNAVKNFEAGLLKPQHNVKLIKFVSLLVAAYSLLFVVCVAVFYQCYMGCIRCQQKKAANKLKKDEKAKQGEEKTVGEGEQKDLKKEE